VQFEVLVAVIMKRLECHVVQREPSILEEYIAAEVAPLHLSGFFLGFRFGPEYGGDKVWRNVWAVSELHGVTIKKTGCSLYINVN
jgi:hypothetical protein